MIRNVFRTINARIGFWLTPLLLLSVLIGAGIAAGYSAANAAPTPSVVSRALGPRAPAAAANGAAPFRATNPSNGGAAIAPEAAIGAPAPRRNAVDATVVRVGAKTPEGQMYIVKDKSNR
ncbi:MAG: hypothetical protein NZ518_03615, partial [Dehalococcoidia bacterium]|nr:hypothetical protein [Dehalococcoidia bacterium]